MLTAAHRVYHWDRRTSSISSDRLEDEALPALEPALAVYRERTGQTRGQVRNAARRALEGLRPDRVEPTVKLLDDAATYERPAARYAERRVEIFEAAAIHVLRRTRAYGVDFARFLAALVRLPDWRLVAQIELRKGWRPLTFTLAAADRLGARATPPAEFDSSLEAAIARKFGTEVALEIVGYWTPEYLADKLRRLAATRDVNLVVAVPQPLAVRAGRLPAVVLPFKRRLLLRDLLPRLEGFRPRL
jgi:predicted nuclease of restriction endonuclease-like RecB superfamily